MAYASVDVLNSQNVFQPYILFVADENRNIISDKGITGMPDLIVEILSPGTEKMIWIKRNWYMSEMV